MTPVEIDPPASAADGGRQVAVIEAVLAYHRAVRAGDLERAAAAFAAEGVLLLPSRPPLVGREALREGLGGLAAGAGAGILGPALLMVDGNRAMALVDPADERAPRPEPIAEIFTFERLRIRQLRVIFDSASQTSKHRGDRDEI